jgi:serpin B
MHSRNDRTWAGRTCAGAMTILALISIAACNGAVATALPAATPATQSPAATPWQTAMWTPAATPSPSPTLTPFIWIAPTFEEPTATPVPSMKPIPKVPVKFPVVMGKAAKLAPAGDHGAALSGSINSFGFELMRHLDSKGNLVFSPTSIALALGLVEPGARGDTAAQMDTILGGLGSSASGPELIALLRELASQTEYFDTDGIPVRIDADGKPEYPAVLDLSKPAFEQLTVSNQAFFQKGMSLQSAYLDALSSRFGAGAGLLDFASNPEAARLTINKWASDRTNGLIPQVLQPGDVDAMTRFELLNAIYFKGHWADEFDPGMTKSLVFYRPDGSSVKVPTMATTTLTGGYSAGAGWRRITLPYSNGTSMTIVMPTDMGTFLAALNKQTFAGLFPAKPKEYIVHLNMPKFSTGTRTDVAKILSGMGMSDVFDPTKADLSGMDGQRDLYVAKVIHQATIAVDEYGTVAAAVTAVGGKGGVGGEIPPETTFHIDHPFLYFIRDNASGAILFMGRIDDPSLKS